jgi:hypothetical protein
MEAHKRGSHTVWGCKYHLKPFLADLCRVRGETGRRLFLHLDGIGGAARGPPGKVRRNAPIVIPVSVIGRLAVNHDDASKSLGADLLSDMLRRIAQTSQCIGIGAALIQARDEAAKCFYLRCAGFLEYPEDSRTMFLPIESVIVGSVR